MLQVTVGAEDNKLLSFLIWRDERKKAVCRESRLKGEEGEEWRQVLSGGRE